MADRTTLTAGIAAASIAAVVAATPALITPPNHDVQVTASAAAALAKRTVSTDVQLVVFTPQGFLSAFADGYEGEIYPDDTVEGVPGAIFYTLDNLLPAEFAYDDAFFVGGIPEVFFALAVDLGVPPDVAIVIVSFLGNPVNTTLEIAELLGLPTIVQDFVNKPVLTVLDTLGGPVLGPLLVALAQQPVNTTLEIAELLGLPTIVQDFVNKPVLTVLNTLGGPVLGPLLVALAQQPVNTTFDILEEFGLPEEVGDFVAQPVVTAARLLAQALDLLPGINPLSTAGLRSVEAVDVAADVDKTPKLFNLDLPTPKEFAEEVDSTVKGFTKVFEPKKPDTLTVETIVADEEDGTELDGDKEEAASSFKLPKLPKPGKVIADFNDNLGRQAQAIANSLKPKDKDDKAEVKETSKPVADTKKDKPHGFGHFGGFKKHKEKAESPT